MMQVKRYAAPTFAEALTQARHELGPDAMIVESKKVKVGGFLGFFQRQVTELTMAIDTVTPPPGATPAPSAPAPVPPAPAHAPAPAGNLTNLEKEVSALRTMLTRMSERGLGPAPMPQLHGFARKAYEELVERGVDETAAVDIGQKLARADGEDIRRVLQAELKQLLGPAAPIEVTAGQRRVVALIGPTGVGKTTTLAKLAAHFTLERGLKVGLMTADTFRIAAIEQLRTYADILGVELHAVDTPADVARALRDTAECDLVLVDTGGRNHKDAKRMQELKEILAVLRPDETHLVFALTANPKDCMEALDYYLPLGVNRLTFTKLDEASSPGLMVNLRMRCNQPLGYVTHGQSVPEDITPADQADFPKILVGA